MDAERSHLSPVEKELLFSKWCEKREIKQFLFDLDGTLCPTHSVFVKQVSLATKFMAEKIGGVSQETLTKEIEEADNRLFEQIGVAPNKWNINVDEISAKYSLPAEERQKAKEILAEIYTSPLELFPDAENALNFLKKSQMPMGVVTHANREWTFRKYNWLNLQRFMDWSDIFVVDENKHKTSESWAEAAKYFVLEPSQCAMVGDSPRSDINPAMEAGFKYRFLYENGEIWSIHKQPIDKSTTVINNMEYFIEIGREMLKFEG